MKESADGAEAPEEDTRRNIGNDMKVTPGSGACRCRQATGLGTLTYVVSEGGWLGVQAYIFPRRREVDTWSTFKTQEMYALSFDPAHLVLLSS
jgi:hypothetical protein